MNIPWFPTAQFRHSWKVHRRLFKKSLKERAISYHLYIFRTTGKYVAQ